MTHNEYRTWEAEREDALLKAELKTMSYKEYRNREASREKKLYRTILEKNKISTWFYWYFPWQTKAKKYNKVKMLRKT